MRELDITLERNSPFPSTSWRNPSSTPSTLVLSALVIASRTSCRSRAGWVFATHCSSGYSGAGQEGLAGAQTRCGHPSRESQFRRNEALSSLNEDIAKAGKIPTTRLLEFSIGTLDQDIRDAIDAAGVSDAEFIKIRRLRLADDVPLAILTNYLPARFEITEADMQSKSLYACLRALGVNLKIAHQQISARLMTEEEAELLDEETPAACLTVDRLAYDDVGQFVEFGRHIYHAAHYSIQSSVVASRRSTPDLAGA